MKTAEQLWVEWGDRFIERGLGGDVELSDDEARAVSLEMVNGILREGYEQGFAEAREAAYYASADASTVSDAMRDIKALTPKETT